MSETMDPMATEVDQQELAQQLLAQAREQGIELVGPDGLFNRLTKNVLETALEAAEQRRRAKTWLWHPGHAPRNGS